MIKRKARRIVKRSTLDKKTTSQNGFGYEVPPDPLSVTIYFDALGHPDLAGNFFSYYTERKWHCPKGTPYSNWKVLASDWIYDFLQTSKLERKRRAKTSFFLMD